LCFSGTPSVQTVGTKVGTPVSLSGQRFTVQIPNSQAASVKSGTHLSPSSSLWMIFLYIKDHVNDFVPNQ